MRNGGVDTEEEVEMLRQYLANGVRSEVVEALLQRPQARETDCGQGGRRATQPRRQSWKLRFEIPWGQPAATVN
jgi:hypothetical protein